MNTSNHVSVCGGNSVLVPGYRDAGPAGSMLSF